MSCSAQKPFERLMDAIGRPEMKDDPRYSTNENRIKAENRSVLNRLIGAWIGEQNLKEVLENGERLGITVGPVTTMKDIEEDLHYNERRSVLEIIDPVTGIPLKIPNLPFRMLSTPGKIRFPGLPHGSANSAILSGFLGYTAEDIVRFKDDGVI
jgi:crotonobetainyl-CoA:carnitine CoA-transferase CaiB-like acyl-CoA transferase